MNPLTIIASACPLLLCAIGALYSEYAGILALFMEGIICFGGFLTFTLTIGTGSALAGTLLSCLLCVIFIFLCSLLIEKFNANRFITGLAINLILGALTTLLSSKIFGTQGVLTSSEFSFDVKTVKILTIIITFVFLVAGILFLRLTKQGLYIRITGTDSQVLIAKGVRPSIYKITSWCVAAFFASLAGSFLVFRISSYVPNISSGRGWMALAAIYLGKKKNWKICLAVLIFCTADIFASSIQNYIPQIPSALLLSLPYLVMLFLSLVASDNTSK